MLKCILNKLLCCSHKIPMTFSRAFSGTSCLYSHYDTLKIKPSADLKEIKEAYFKLSKQYHPDLHPNDPKCHDRFIRLQEAYKILSNAESRRNYDSQVHIRTKHSNANHRPYGYPDFTERDEWIRSEQAKRETRFQQEFRYNQDGHYEFNKFYSRPHKLTREEMESYYKYKKFTKNNRPVWIILGFFFIVALCEALFVRKGDRFPRHNSIIDEHWRRTMMSNPQYALEYERRKQENDLKYQEYLRQRDAVRED